MVIDHSRFYLDSIVHDTFTMATVKVQAIEDCRGKGGFTDAFMAWLVSACGFVCGLFFFLASFLLPPLFVCVCMCV